MTDDQVKIVRKELSTLRKAAEASLERLDILEKLLGRPEKSPRQSRKAQLRNYFEMNDLTGSVKKPAELKKAR